MSRKLIILLGVLFIVLGFLVYPMYEASAAEGEIQFAWDPQEQGEGIVSWQSVEVYYRTDGAEYNYNEPFIVVPQIDGGPSETPVVPILFPNNEKTTFYFVARAKASVGGEVIASADSNEISTTFDHTPLPQFGFQAVYNDTSNSIDFTWTKDDDRITSYKIFQSAQEGQPGVEIAEIQVGEAFTPTTTIPKGTLFPDNQLTTIYFTMAAYGQYGLEIGSPVTVPITQDYRDVEKVVNFKIVLK